MSGKENEFFGGFFKALDDLRLAAGEAATAAAGAATAAATAAATVVQSEAAGLAQDLRDIGTDIRDVAGLAGQAAAAGAADVLNTASAVTENVSGLSGGTLLTGVVSGIESATGELQNAASAVVSAARETVGQAAEAAAGAASALSNLDEMQEQQEQAAEEKLLQVGDLSGNLLPPYQEEHDEVFQQNKLEEAARSLEERQQAILELERQAASKREEQKRAEQAEQAEQAKEVEGERQEFAKQLDSAKAELISNLCRATSYKQFLESKSKADFRVIRLLNLEVLEPELQKVNAAIKLCDSRMLTGMGKIKLLKQTRLDPAVDVEKLLCTELKTLETLLKKLSEQYNKGFENTEEEYGLGRRHRQGPEAQQTQENERKILEITAAIKRTSQQLNATRGEIAKIQKSASELQEAVEKVTVLVPLHMVTFQLKTACFFKDGECDLLKKRLEEMLAEFPQLNLKSELLGGRKTRRRRRNKNKTRAKKVSQINA